MIPNVLRETVIRTLTSAAVLVLLATPAMAQGYVDSWHCKLNDNIPLGTLTIASDGSYEMVVAANSTWARKDGDPGNGSGQLSIDGDILTPVSGPLLDVYEVVGGYRDVDRRYIGWGNNSVGLGLFACWPASEVN